MIETMKRIVGIFMSSLFVVNTIIVNSSSIEPKSRATYPVQLIEWELVDDNNNPKIHIEQDWIAKGPEEYQDVYETILESVCRFDKDVEVETNLEQDIVVRIFKAATMNPEVFWVSNGAKIELDNNRCKILFDYYMGKEEVLDNIKRIDKKTKLLFQEISETSTKADVSEKICSWICANVKYDTSQNIEDYTNSSIEGVFINGKALCGGYSNAYVYLMARAGYEAAYCTGFYNNIFHAWNKYDDNGRILGIDVTHADNIAGIEPLYMSFDNSSSQWRERKLESEAWYTIIP